MKRSRTLIPIFIAFAAIVSVGGCSVLEWSDYQSGMARVQQDQRRGLVIFSTAMSAESREMDAVYNDEEIQRLLKHFVLIRADAVLDQSVADQFGVSTLPAFFIIRPDLTVAAGSAGKMDVDTFRAFLIKHCFD